MTREQIAELREWCNSDSYETPDADAILKLLDEREALLEALRELLARVPLTDVELGARVKLAKVAIAKAEAP